MRELIKSYHLFLPQMWKKLLLYLVYPLALMELICLFAKTSNEVAAYLVSCCSLLLSAELYFDILVFGGIASKDSNKLEYLKTSVKGMDVLRKSIVVDGIRRFLSFAVILVGAYVIAGMDLSLVELAMCLLATLFMTEAGLLVIRGFAAMSVMIGTTVIGGIALTILLIAVWETLAPVTASGLFAILYAAVWVLGRIFVMKKARGSYYDEWD